MVLPVPDGTVVSTADGEVLADLVGAGAEVVAAQGGKGGLGNAALASSARKAPGFALLGEPGEERLTLVLELKVVADVGLVGSPAPASPRWSPSISRGPAEDRRLPVHDPDPNLGVVTARDTTFTVADVPGLIEGASEGQAGSGTTSCGTSSGVRRWCTSSTAPPWGRAVTRSATST